MKRHARKVQMPTVIVAIVLLIVAGLAALNYFATRNVTSSHIVLPKDSELPVLISGQSENYIIVTKDNLSDVVASLSRPLAYHQSLIVTNVSGEQQSAATVELWVRGEVSQITTSSADSVRHILTDGKEAFVWYDSNQRSVAHTVLPQDMIVDDLVGIPTYESILNVLPDDILDAGFAQLSAPMDNPCIYGRIQRGDTGWETVWIDTASGLLCKAEYEKDDAVFCVVEQSALEILNASDASIQTVFYLPDGSEPYPATVEAETPRA